MGHDHGSGAHAPLDIVYQYQEIPELHEDIAMRWSRLTSLATACLSMFLGALVAGTVVGRSASKTTLKWLHVFGTGLLVGTALGVIIPEGVESLYEAASSSKHEASGHHHGDEGESLSETTIVGAALTLGFLCMTIADTAVCGGDGGSHGHSHGGEDDECEAEPLDVELQEEVTALKSELEDPVPSLASETTPTSTPLKKTSVILRARSASPYRVAVARSVSANSNASNAAATMTLGLFIHNACDGLALGASRAASKEWGAAQSVVFGAIMLHHIPAAIGFATFLRSKAMDESQVQRRMLAFAAAGPVTAMLAYFLLSKEFVGLVHFSTRAVAGCLLFSGGTFLYVAAVHALREVLQQVNAQSAKVSKKQLGQQLLVFSLGALLPVIVFASGGAHEH